MTTAPAPTALDCTGYEIRVGDRVGSFSRDVAGTVDQIRLDAGDLQVRHDGDRELTTYLVGPESGAAPGLFKLNLSSMERRP